MSFSIEDEAPLLARVSNSDESAFRELLQKYHRQVYGYIIHLIGSREDAEEIVQDVFMKIWKSRSGLSEVKDFKAYLFVISRNLSYNKLRQAVRVARLLKQWEKEQNIDVPTQTDEDDKNFMFKILDKAIERLPKRQQEIFLLHKRERLQYVEIANRLDIGKETVKSHLKAAIKSIKIYLKSFLLLFVIIFLINSPFFI